MKLKADKVQVSVSYVSALAAQIKAYTPQLTSAEMPILFFRQLII